MSVSTGSRSARGRFGALANLKVKTKILCGFAVVLALFAVTAAVVWSSFRDVEAGFGQYEMVSTNAMRTQSIDRDIVGIRRNVLVYLQSGSADALSRIKELRESLTKTVETAIDNSPTQERREQLGKVKQLLARYETGLDRLVSMRAEREKAVTEGLVALATQIGQETSKIVEAATAAGDTAGALGISRAQQQFMVGRIAVWRYLVTEDEKDAAAAQTGALEAAKQVHEAAAKLSNPETKRAAAAVEDRLSAYAEGVKAVVTAVQAINTLFNVEDERLVSQVNETVAAVMKAQTEALARTRAAASDTLGHGSRLSVGAAGLGVVLGLLLAWLIGNGIARPVVAMTKAMKALAGGDKNAEIPARDRKDEVGEMAGAVVVFKDNMIEADRLRAEQEQVKARAEADKKASMNKMADEFEAGVKGIVQMVTSAATELQATAQSMSATAEETSRQSTAVAAASEQASSNVQTVATAAEELSSSIAEISRQVSESTRIAGEASEQATATNTQIQGLAESAQRIGDVVKLITDIAGQTNLLALNATIEAARAGEAGKGFAVVASEVKSLANQTAKATEEISAKIAEMQAATGQSVQAVQTIGETIGRINEIATTIASAVEEQGAATKEIARNVQQASVGTGEVSANIAGVTKAASDTGSAAAQVLGASGELAKQSETLQTQVDGFIAKIRAA